MFSVVSVMAPWCGGRGENCQGHEYESSDEKTWSCDSVLPFFQLAHDLVTSLHFYSSTLWCIFWLVPCSDDTQDTSETTSVWTQNKEISLWSDSKNGLEGCQNNTIIMLSSKKLEFMLKTTSKQLLNSMSLHLIVDFVCSLVTGIIHVTWMALQRRQWNTESFIQLQIQFEPRHLRNRMIQFKEKAFHLSAKRKIKDGETAPHHAALMQLRVCVCFPSGSSSYILRQAKIHSAQSTLSCGEWSYLRL